MSQARASINVKSGWNLVGYPRSSGEGAADELASLGSTVVQIKNLTSSYDPSIPSFLNTLSSLSVKDGYWLKVSEDVSLDVEEHGLELLETGVGFKYICTEMQKGNVLLGFEESGGIGFPGHIPERDGILAGLALLELLATEKTSVNRLLAKLEKQFGPHRYDRLDTHFPLEKRAKLMKHCAANPPAKLVGSLVTELKTFDGVKYIAANGAWLMLRGSGTEPILRIHICTGRDK